ncbi:hypothetical protein C7974DRAFT_299322 [Boeremia exigua]|uniref:uncharacterized protein n=1 Tax=Boeremia exigua TaxID=749465 RepID=UPI001E8EE716|nr:uncharacterized protein C7974DRAFT_299322 [Boeremia exigua]KAH6643941.1 hypothetical protein C7974DRAFT_299322 [Boeremia exigua]
MLVTGIILAPVAMATPAVQDLANLRAVIETTASTIGDLKNPNRGWGFFGSSNGQMSTADLINNITSTVLQSKFQIDTNKTAWLNLTSLTADPNSNTTVPLPETPTLPMSSSMVLPSTLPTGAPIPENTTDLSAPYVEYVSSIPNLSTSLISLGRAWHREMNAPVNQAVAVLQESINSLQITMLQSELIGSPAVLRTIRASSSLESAQLAWSRFLNLPGSTGRKESGDDAPGASRRRSVQRLPPVNGRQYTHKELWGRRENTRAGDLDHHNTVVESPEQVGDRHVTAQLFKA